VGSFAFRASGRCRNESIGGNEHREQRRNSRTAHRKSGAFQLVVTKS
jgi:hypothetical protein